MHGYAVAEREHCIARIVDCILWGIVALVIGSVVYGLVFWPVRYR